MASPVIDTWGLGSPRYSQSTDKGWVVTAVICFMFDGDGRGEAAIIS